MDTLHPDRIEPGRLQQIAAWDFARAKGSAAWLIHAYSRMRTIRIFERKCSELSGGARPLVAGSVHTCEGHEAVPVGTLSELGAQDRLVATYRGHGWLLESGVPLDQLMAELCHRSTGINGGRAGSAYIMAPEYGVLGENSIVGAGVPIACGAALAFQRQSRDGVVVVSFGDGAMSQGAVHEGMVFAAAERLPVVMICENNGWSELTPTADLLRIQDLSERLPGYGIPAITVDGCDPLAVSEAVREAVKRARSGGGPSFIECKTVRLGGHYNGDMQLYRPKAEAAEALRRDPLARLRQHLLDQAVVSADELQQLDDSIKLEIESTIDRVQNHPLPDIKCAANHVIGETKAASPQSGSADAPPEEMTFGAAVNQALRDELGARREMIVYGEDVGFSGGVFGVTRRLQKDFGKERVFDTPIAESAILGSAVGAALEGMRPVVEIMWSDFLLVALDQIVNQAANVRYITGGRRTVPIVIRTQQGATPGSCAQHSQCLEALLAHIPGVHVGLPSNPQDAYSMLRAAIANPDPCILFEARGLYQRKGLVQAGKEIEPVGGARLRKPGKDLALISWGRMVNTVMEASESLAGEGIDAAVLDLRWLAPLDDAAIDSVVRICGGRVLIVHEANRTGGFGAEISARIAERNQGTTVIGRLATPDTRIPAAPNLQAALIPSVAAICAGARELFGAKR